MRDPKRIDPILEAVRRAWKTSPDFRLGHLIESQGLFQGREIDPFDMEDDEMLAALERWPNRFPIIRRQESGEQG